MFEKFWVFLPCTVSPSYKFLWTSPYILRDSGARKTTLQHDVYSSTCSMLIKSQSFMLFPLSSFVIFDERLDSLVYLTRVSWNHQCIVFHQLMDTLLFWQFLPWDVLLSFILSSVGRCYKSACAFACGTLPLKTEVVQRFSIDCQKTKTTTIPTTNERVENNTFSQWKKKANCPKRWKTRVTKSRLL